MMLRRKTAAETKAKRCVCLCVWLCVWLSSLDPVGVCILALRVVKCVPLV